MQERQRCTSTLTYLAAVETIMTVLTVAQQNHTGSRLLQDSGECRAKSLWKIIAAKNMIGMTSPDLGEELNESNPFSKLSTEVCGDRLAIFLKTILENWCIRN